MRRLLILALLYPGIAHARGFNGSQRVDPEASRSLGEPVVIPEVPGEDVFGTTAPTDVGNPGDYILTNENDGRVGKRGGSFASVSSKTQLGYTVNTDLWAAFALFDTGTRLRGIPDIGPDNQRVAFDGASIEFQYRVLERTQANPFAISLDVEGAWNRLDVFTGQYDTTLSITPKVFVDAVVVPNRVYWGLNLSYTPQRERFPTGSVNSSGLLTSTALAYEFDPAVIVGIEARYLDGFSKPNLTRFSGDALFVGPTLVWKLSDSFAINATYSPQVYGRQTGSPGRLDVVDFERQNFRLKISYGW